MEATESGRNPVEVLAEEFIERRRRGERPTLEEYAGKFPQLAESIRQLFPALVMMEKLGAESEFFAASGSDSRATLPRARLEQIGDFRILREIGRGGMGVVYEAEQESLGRRVALKVLSGRFPCDKGHVQRFEREARSAARLHHTNIVPVFGVGQQDGMHYYVMQFIQGQGLDEVLRELKRLRMVTDDHSPADRLVASREHSQGTLAIAELLLSGEFRVGAPDGVDSGIGTDACSCEDSPSDVVPANGRNGLSDSSITLPGDSELSTVVKSELQYARSVARIGIQVAGALEYANTQGIFHRDVKPSNLLLDIKGTVWVTDFGLAKSTETSDLTHTGDIVGTLRYMAPERFQGHGDARSDVYSLGLTLYELLALRPAYDEHDRQRLIQRVIQEQPLRLDKLNSAVPRDLATVIHKAIEPEPDHRYATAGDLANDLQRFLDDKPTEARHIRPHERLWRWGRRNKATMAAALLVTLALVIGTTVSVWQAVVATNAKNAEHQTAIGLERANQRLAQEEQATQRELVRAQAAEEKATRELFEALVAAARANRLSRRVGQRYESLETLRKATAMARHIGLPHERFLELRNEAIAAMALPDLRVANEWPHRPGCPVGFDARLERYASIDPEKGTIEVWRVGEQEPMCRLAGINPGGSWPALSPDGGYLGVREVSRGWIHVWKLAGTEPPRVLSAPSLVFAFSPDSRQVARQVLDDGSIVVRDLATGEEARRIPNMPRVSWIAWHPSGTQLALACDAFVQVRDLETGDLLWHKDLAPQAWRYVAWHPDGTTLAVTDGDTVSLWQVANDKQVARLEGKQAGGVVLGFNPAGNLLASNQWASLLKLFDPLTGRRLLITHSGIVSDALRFSPNGRFLAGSYDDMKMRIWEVAAGDEYRTLMANPMRGGKPYWCVAVSGNGRWLAAGTSGDADTPGGAVALWDLLTGREVAFQHDSWYVAFEKGSLYQGVGKKPAETLLSMGPNGMVRQPLHVDLQHGAVQLGVAESLGIPGANNGFSQSRDGRVLVSAQFRGALVRHADQPDKLIRLEGQDDVRHVAMSPDGRWVATAHFAFGGIKVWKLEASASGVTYDFVTDLPINGLGLPIFSPDGKRLLACTGPDVRVHRFDVGSWVEIPFDEPVEGRNPAFSPDGKLIVLGTGSGAARLIDAESGREYARLEDPNQHATTQFAFTPDCAKLVCASEEGECVHVWDLAAIRRQLAEMGLDWEPQPFLPSPDGDVEAIEVEVEPGK